MYLCLSICSSLIKLQTALYFISCRKTASHPIPMVYSSVSQRPGRGPVPGPGINYTGPREVLLEVVILVF